MMDITLSFPGRKTPLIQPKGRWEVNHFWRQSHRCYSKRAVSRETRGKVLAAEITLKQ